MKSGMDKTTGTLITGLAYLRQRLEDVINTPLGSVPGARGFGSRLFELVDSNIDSDFYMSAYEHLADAISDPANGVTDFRLSEMLVTRAAPNHYTFRITGTMLVNDEPVTLDGINLHGQ
jgi:hypothetical protein